MEQNLVFSDYWCPVFQYHVTWLYPTKKFRLVIGQEIVLPRHRFKKAYVEGRKQNVFFAWVVEQLTHETLHQVLHEQISYKASEALDNMGTPFGEF